MKGLHVDSVTKGYGMNQVLTDVYISCQRGEIVGLLGRNGSGKSTLLKIIFGSLMAGTKYVSIDDKYVHGLSKNCKYLPQTNFLPDHLKISKIIALFCQKEIGEQLLDHECIRPLLNNKCSELSGGEKRLVEIFLILHSDADYILMDEPFNGIAPVYKEEIKDIIRKQSKHKGFIVTDHDYRNILDVANRIILMFDGGTKVITHRDELEQWGYLVYD